MSTGPILVIGSASQLGQSFCQCLLDRGYHVYGADLEGNEFSHAHYGEFQLNLEDEQSLEEFLIEFSSQVESLRGVIFCSFQTIEDDTFHRQQWLDHLVYNLISPYQLILSLQDYFNEPCSFILTLLSEEEQLSGAINLGTHLFLKQMINQLKNDLPSVQVLSRVLDEKTLSEEQVEKIITNLDL